jgi:hypothetical protein
MAHAGITTAQQDCETTMTLLNGYTDKINDEIKFRVRACESTTGKCSDNVESTGTVH